MRDCRHERYGRPDAYCPDCDVSWEIVERDQRIAELEALDKVRLAQIDTLCKQVIPLEAENRRLRDAAQAVVDSATPHYDRWVNGVTRICINRLAALLGGGE